MGVSVTAPRALATGVVVGGLAGAASLQPSILPRSRKQQAMLSAGSVAAGFGAGAIAARLSNAASRRMPGGALAVYGGLVATGLGTQAWSHLGDGVPSPTVGAIGSAGTIAAVTGAAGLAVMAARRAGRFGAPLALAAGVGAVGLTFAHTTRENASTTRGVDDARSAYARVSERPLPAEPGAFLDTVTGGPRSTIARSEMSKYAIRFAHEVTPGRDIRRVMGSGIDPVRAYASLGSGDTARERVDVAMQEAEKLGAFDGSRKYIVLVTPTGSGFIDPPAIQAAEYMTRGEIASIAVQYGDAPSIKSTGKIPLAAETTRLMVDAVHARIAKLPENEQPEIVLFGESLGAWAQQDAFEGGGLKSLRQAGVDRALWVGTPHESSFRGEVLNGSLSDASGTAHQLNRIEDFESLPHTQQAAARYFFLQHNNDPVSIVNKATIAFQRPEWMPARGERPLGIPSDFRYFPGVTGGQAIVDLINGTKPIPGRFEATGHDYRADLAEFTRVAFGLHGTVRGAVTDEQVSAITAELVYNELVRANYLKNNPQY